MGLSVVMVVLWIWLIYANQEKSITINVRYNYFKECLKKLINRIESLPSFKNNKNPRLVAGYDIMCKFLRHLQVKFIFYKRKAKKRVMSTNLKFYKI